MEKTEPIKRSPQLAPLSREHHDGLLFVWKIRQGLQNNTDVLTIADFILWYDEQHLKTHFETEEKLLPPFFPAGDLLFSRCNRNMRRSAGCFRR
ncbi:MAG: hypothetical protein HC867_03800 [Bacteroidia bacterium]|nr:hypothetical protein [Bacteroidia bacterium]